MDISTLIQQAARKWPTALALREGERELTFAALDRAITGVGVHLHNLGVAVGERVALLADAGIDYLLADYGCMANGYVRVPLDTALAHVELLAQVQDAGAALLLFGPEHAGSAGQLAVQGIRCVALETLNVAIAELPDRPAQPMETLASLNYTGGTTGQPKAVMHSHASLGAALQNIVMARIAQPGDVLLNVRPLWPIAAVAVFAHLLAGGCVVLGGRFNPATFIEQLQRQQVAFSSLVPTQLLRLIREQGTAPADLPFFKCLDVGAAAMSSEVLEGACALLGERLGVLYGMTEAPWSCYFSPAQLAEVRAAGGTGEGVVGRPAFSAALRIARADANGVGEILLTGPQLMRGYWRQAELSESVLEDGWLRSGDLGQLLPDGRLRVLGRTKEIIRSGGKSIQPGEVEHCLLEHPQVAEAHVFGLSDEEWGERVCAAVVASGVEAAQLEAHCRAQLSRFKVPKTIFFVSELPRSHYGKVQRKRLLEMLGVSA
ncbi:class I adenylate-forming enzyme family protein [Pseudomonas sp. Marseille-Q8238]